MWRERDESASADGKERRTKPKYFSTFSRDAATTSWTSNGQQPSYPEHPDGKDAPGDGGLT